MTISTTSSSTIAGGNNVSTVFQFSFVADAASYIELVYTDTSGVSVTVPPAQYSVSLNPILTGQLWSVGGSVTYPLSGTPIASGTSLTIRRVLPLQQLTEISNQGNFYTQVTEQALDTLEMQIQQVSARTGALRGTWVTATQYSVGDVVQDGVNGSDTENYYTCAISNLSDVWTTDLAAGDWSLSLPATIPVATLPLSIGNGGTGASTAAGALTNLGAASLAGSNTYTGANNFTGGSILMPTRGASDSSTNGANTAFVATNFAALAGASFTGNVGIGATKSVTYTLNVVQAGANQAYFGSTGVNNSNVVIDNAAGGNVSILSFANAGITQWQLLKTSTGAFSLYDLVGSKTFINATTGANLVLGANQSIYLTQTGGLYVGQSTNPATSNVVIQVQTGTANGINCQATSDTGTSFPLSVYNHAGSYVGGITNTSSATAFATSSDKRLKRNVIPLGDVSEKIDALSPVSYTWSFIEGNPTGVGFVAQDIYNVIPEAVIVGDNGPADPTGKVEQQWAIDYSKIVPYLVAEIQSLRARLMDADIP